MDLAEFRECSNEEKGRYLLAVFRILLGWIMIWPFFDKLLGLGFATPRGSGMIDGGSPSSFVTWITGGIFKGVYESLAGNPAIDIILMAALLVLGMTLTLGFASKLSTLGMTAFLLVMYTIVVPPTDNPVIDDHILLAVGMLAVYLLGGFERLSINEKWKESPLVKRFPILG